MIVRYSYIDNRYGSTKHVYGEYQCDLDDFKSFFKHRHELKIRSMILHKANGDIWIWQAGGYAYKDGREIWIPEKWHIALRNQPF